MLTALAAVRAAAQQVDSISELKRLSNDIGPRLTGSSAITVAERELLSYMNRIGLQHVHLEGWRLPRAWQRGSATASLVAPFRLPIPVAAYGWTGSTPAHSGSVPIVLINADDLTDHFDALIAAQANGWAGKVLLISSHAAKPMRAYAQLLPLLEAATGAHAMAVFRHDSRPGSGIVHTEPSSVVLPQTVSDPLIPALDLPSEHEKLLEDLLIAGRPARVEISVTNTFSAGPVTSNNVVGEMIGTTHPDQVLLIGAHLDSWDLGTGATDDGFGISAVLAAAETLVRSGVRPDHTLRFVFFEGEEQGLLGSRAYVEQHSSELNHMLAAIALDWGAGPITKLPAAGHPEMIPLLSRFNELVPELHLEAPDEGYLFMTDAYAFTLTGLPGIAPLIRSPDYLEQAHSLEDTFDKVHPSDLRQTALVLAMVACFLGETPEWPKTHLTRTETAAALQQGN